MSTKMSIQFAVYGKIILLSYYLLDTLLYIFWLHTVQYRNITFHMLTAYILNMMIYYIICTV